MNSFVHLNMFLLIFDFPDTKILSTVIHNSFYNIISALKQFADYALIQEAALEVLTVASKSGKQFLHFSLAWSVLFDSWVNLHRFVQHELKVIF